MFGAALLGGPKAARAQSTQNTPDTIIISLSPLSNTGVDEKTFAHPVQVLTSRQISQGGEASATRALAKNTAGVNLVNSQANPYQPTILYHGFEISPIQGTPAGLSVYVNGARFNTPFGDLAIWSLLPDAAMSALSVEDGNPVFGLNALGGAINVQMKNGFHDPGGEVAVSGGSFGKIDANAQYGKQFDNTAVYVDAETRHEAGWRDSQSSDIQNFYGDVGWRGQAAHLHVNATLANSALNGPGTVPLDILNADPAAEFTGPNRIADKYFKLGGTLDVRLSAETSLQAAFYYDNLWEQLYNGNGPNDLPCGPGIDAAYLCQGGPGGALSTTRNGAPIPAFLSGPGAGGYSGYAQLNVNTSNTNGYGGSVQVSNQGPVFGLKNRLIAGLSYDGGFTHYNAAGYVGAITANSRIYYTPGGIPGPGYIIDEPGTVPTGVVIRNAYYGAYVSDTLSLTKKLSLNAGLRLNLADLALHDQNPADPNAAGGGLTGRHEYSHFNPGFGVTYNATPYMTWFASYAVENAAPTPAELSCASPADACSLANFMSGDPPLKQIVTRSFDVGVRGTTLGPWQALVSYNADYYDSIASDDVEFLQSPYNPVGQGYFSNIGNVRRTGIDAGVQINTDKWQIYANDSVTEATYRSQFVTKSNNPHADANGNITIMPGDHLPGVPQNIFKFGATYAATPKLTLGVVVTAQTSSYLYGDAANLTPPLPGYAVADITARYRLTPRLTFFGGINNVTDTKYYNYGTFSPTGANGGVYVAQAPNYSNPRSYSLAAPVGVYAGMRFKFGN